MPTPPTLEVSAVTKEYRRGLRTVRALDGVSFSVCAGEALAVVGPSGSGKSTLMHLLGGLDRPDRGRVVANGIDLGGLDDDALTAFRRCHVGFVFQFFNLLPTLSAWENVALPRLLDGISLRSERERAIRLLEMVGLENRFDHRPAELSGGQLQRVAVARALVNDPAIVLADEPTGNLDSTAGHAVLELLRTLASADARTLVIVTHDVGVARGADRIIEVADGRVAAHRARPDEALAPAWAPDVGSAPA